MGDEQRLSADEQLRPRASASSPATDFTVAIEEEYAILDPETLALTNRFEDLQAAAAGTALEEHLVGELIASEVEVRTGRRETFAEAAARMAERRASSRALAERLGVALGATGTHPWSPLAGAAHHRHAALPAKRRAAPLRRLAQQHLRAARPRRRSGEPTGRRGHRRRCATFLPELLALSASSPFVEGVNTRPALGAHADLHELLPALRRPRRLRRLGRVRAASCGFLYDTGSIDEHTQIWWSVRPHLAFPTVEIRICDGQPRLEEASRSPRSRTRSRRGSRAQSTRASRCRSRRTG